MGQYFRMTIKSQTSKVLGFLLNFHLSCLLEEWENSTANKRFTSSLFENPMQLH